MRVAAIQLNSGAEKARNLETAERLVRDAASDGAALVALPEKWNLLGSREDLIGGAEPLDGPTLRACREWARELGVAVLAGSIAERVPGEERLYNTSVLIDADGEDVATYRKIHMFDVEVGGVAYRESETEQGGDEIALGELEAGDRTVPIGLSVCYDLRFPELYRILAVRGAELVTVPAAFTAATGRAHWEALLRARAIENQCFVVAPDQVGEAPPQYDSHGHSMLVGPWGEVLAELPGGEGIAIAELDFAELERVREKLPSLANRRPDAYRWPQMAEAQS